MDLAQMCLDAGTSAPCRQPAQADSHEKRSDGLQPPRAAMRRTGSFHAGLDRGARQLDLKSRFLSLLGAERANVRRAHALEELEEEGEDDSAHTTAESMHSPLVLDASTPPSLWSNSSSHAHEDMDMDQGRGTSHGERHHAFSRAVPSTLGRPPMPPSKSQSLPSSPLQPGRAPEGATPLLSENGVFAPVFNSFPCSTDSPTNLFSRACEVKKRAADSDDLCLMQVRQKLQRFDLSDACSPRHRRTQSNATSTLPVGPLPTHMTL